jgi:hypothetical protein
MLHFLSDLFGVFHPVVVAFSSWNGLTWGCFWWYVFVLVVGVFQELRMENGEPKQRFVTDTELANAINRVVTRKTKR